MAENKFRIDDVINKRIGHVEKQNYFILSYIYVMMYAMYVKIIMTSTAILYG